MEAESEQKHLKRSIGLWSAVAINVGAIIGGGIFVVIGVVAGYAGSAMIVSMIIAGLIAFFTALSFARLTAWQPVEGGAYEYGRQLVSPILGFLAGWMWIVANTFTGAAVSLGFAYYLTAMFPSLPSNAIAAILCLAFTLLNLIGVRESARVNNVLVAVKLSVLAFFIIYGAYYINIENLSPFNPLSSGVLYGSFFIFFAYGGFARVSVVAEEIKDAKRNVPRALLLSLAISMLIYVMVGLVAVGLISSVGMAGSSSPLRLAIDATGNPLAVSIVSLGGLVATASVLLTAILGVSRMTYSMARRKDFPSSLARLHSRFYTPYYAIIVTGLLMVGIILFVDLKSVVAVSTFALVFTYSVTNIAAYRLNTNNKRNLEKIISLVGLSTCLMLFVFMFFATQNAWVAGMVFLIAGIILYALRRKFGSV